jgi:potassium-transporting ATPase potassium-binding subunit
VIELVHIPIFTLVLAGISLVIPAGTSSIFNPGFHGLSEVTYAFASSANNNGRLRRPRREYWLV